MNVLLIHDSVREYQAFVDSVNQQTIPFVYGPSTTRDDFTMFLQNKDVQRIGFVFEIGMPLLGRSFFESADYLNSLNVPNLDFLACNTLLLPEWKQFYSKLTGVIGASNNPTGNLQYGGDWLLESTCEDVEKTYFTTSIQYYKYLLENMNCMAFIKNRTVYVSGFNRDGQLCIGPTTDMYVYTYTDLTNAVNASTGLAYNTDDFKSRVPKWVSISDYTFFIIMEDGTLWGAGQNNGGLLGVGNSTATVTFKNITAVNSFGSRIPVYINSSYNHVVILMNDNTLWGTSRSSGIIGIPSYSSNNLFQNITNSQSEDFKARKPIFVEGTTGYAFFILVLMKDGTVWGTGRNSYGELGLGNTTAQTTFQNLSAANPTTIGSKRAIGLSTVRYFGATVVLLEDYTIWAAGSNQSQLFSTTSSTVLSYDLTYNTFQNIWANQSASFKAKRAKQIFHTFRGLYILMKDKSIWTQFISLLSGSSSNLFEIIQTQSAAFIAKTPKHFYVVDGAVVLLMTDGSMWGAGSPSMLGLGVSGAYNYSFVQLTTGVSAISKGYSYTVIDPIPAITSISPLTGSVNTVLTITGTGLDNIEKVLFNEQSVIPTSVDSTAITVSVPVNIGKTTISVVDNANLLFTSATPFTYVAVNQPTITTTVTNFNVGSTDIQSYLKNKSQMLSFKPDITSQSKSMINTMSVYKKNITVQMTGSPAGDTVITFGNQNKRVKWVGCGEGSNTLAYSYDGINWTGLGTSMFTTYGLTVGFNGSIWTAGGGGTNTLAYSYDGINWTGLGTSIFTSFCHGLLWNQTMCVAGGNGKNSLAYSYDGLNWTGLGQSIMDNVWGINWNGTMWLALGQGKNSMAYSYDGIQWNIVHHYYTKCIIGVCATWNGTMWVAGGEGTFPLAYSYDGILWTGIDSSSLFRQCREIAWNGKIWVAIGFSPSNLSVILYSYDGKVWKTAINVNTVFTGSSLFGISWNGQMFVATAIGVNTLGYSYDGINWYGLGSSIFTTGRKIFHSNRYENSIVIKRRRIVVGCDSDTDSSGNRIGHTLAYSTDGITWTGLGFSLFTARCYGIAYNGRMWVAVGSGTNTLGISFDGQSWVSILSVTTSFSDGYCISWNGKMWLAGGMGTTNILYSYDGLTWAPSANSNAIMATQVYSIDWNGTLWVAVGIGATSTMYSYDGITWIAGANVFSASSAIKVLWNGSMFLAAGSGTTSLAYSYNGILWVPVSSTINGHGIAWNGTMWMTSDGSYSYDGIQWTIPTLLINNGMYVIWTGSLWLNVGYGYMAYSYDGVQWTYIGSPVFSSTGYGVCACSDLWNEYTNTNISMQTQVIAVGSSPNSIAYSNDGIQWTGLGTSIFTNGFAIAYNGSRWVAGGQGTHTLAYSDDGINWIGLGATLFTNGCFEVAWNGSLWVAVGTGTNTIAYSSDGKTWTPVTNAFFTISNTVAWDGKRWIAGGGTATSLATSLDGKTWAPLNQYTNIGIVIGIEYNGSMWVAGGESSNANYSLNGLSWTNGISWSDGITWTDGVSAASSLSITIVDQVFIVYSYDGLNWFRSTCSLLSSVQSFAWNGTMWIAVGVGSSFSILYSYDGINWTGVPNSYAMFPTGALGITWNGLRWIVAGNGSASDSLAYSVDGIQWNKLGKTIMGNGYGIGPRIYDAELEPGDNLLTFTTDSYYQQGYTNITIGVSNTQ